MNPKSIWLSKTLWIALLQGILGVVVVIGTSAPDLGWLLVAKSVLDMVIRFLTIQPVEI